MKRTLICTILTFPVLIALIAGITLLHEKHPDKQANEMKLTPIFESRDALNMSSIVGMTVTRSGLFLVAEKNRVVCLDENGHITHTIGRPGQGPGELQGVNSIGTTQDRIVLFEPWLNKVSEFSLEGALLGSWTLPVAGVNNMFVLSGERFLLVVPGTKTALVVLKRTRTENDDWKTEVLHQKQVPTPAFTWMVIQDNIACYIGRNPDTVYEYNAEYNTLLKRLQLDTKKKQAESNSSGTLHIPLFSDYYAAIPMGNDTILINGKNCETGEYLPRSELNSITIAHQGDTQCRILPFTFHPNVVYATGNRFYLIDNLDQHIHGYILETSSE